MESDASKKTTTGSKVSSPDIISPVQRYISLGYNGCAILASRYLHKPYLIGGNKFDLRIYVYVTSYDPLRIYIFSDGLVRFASCKSVSTRPHCDNCSRKLSIMCQSRAVNPHWRVSGDFESLLFRYSSSMKTLSNKFMHLTNYSVNKKNTEYQTNSDDKACQGHKW